MNKPVEWRDGSEWIAVDLYATLAEQQLEASVQAHLERQCRVIAWHRRVRAFCLAIAVFCAVYFPLRLLIGAVS